MFAVWDLMNMWIFSGQPTPDFFCSSQALLHRLTVYTKLSFRSECLIVSLFVTEPSDTEQEKKCVLCYLELFGVCCRVRENQDITKSSMFFVIIKIRKTSTGNTHLDEDHFYYLFVIDFENSHLYMLQHFLGVQNLNSFNK